MHSDRLFYRSLFDQTNDAVFILDLNGIHVKVNNRASEMLGYTVDEMENLSYRDLSADATQSQKHMEQLLKESSLPVYEHEFRKKSGEIIPVEINLQLIKDDLGKPVYIQSVVRDISERKKMQQELDNFFNINLDLLCIADVEGNFVKVNKEWERVLGYTTDELCKKNFLEFVHPDDIQDTLKAMTKLSKQEPVMNFINRYQSKDGTYRVIEWRSQPYGRLIYAAARDITEHKNLNSLIIAEKERLKTTLLSIGDGVISADHDGRILLMNKVAEEITGWKQDEAIGKFVQEVYQTESARDRDSASNSTNNVLNQLDFNKMETVKILQSKVGSERLIEEKVTPVKGADEQTTGVVLVFRDVEESVQKQSQIEYLSYHDQLTGLFNRRYFEIELKRHDQLNELPITIVIIDVNNMKLTNDVFGHAVGDLLLKKISEMMVSVCRKSDVIARIGGDEFAIVLPKTSAEEASTLIKRLDDNISEEKINGLSLSIAYGFETKVDSDTDLVEILKIADDKMYKRKVVEGNAIRAKTKQLIIESLNKKSDHESQHAENVSKLCRLFSVALDLPESNMEELVLLGYLHDIGKVVINERILNKSDLIDESDWDEIRRHPEAGYRILMALKESIQIAEYCLTHHERWDGKGYPKGLKGTDIPWQSRVIAIAEAYETLISGRPYKSAVDQEAAIQILKENAGRQFDPELVDVFINKVIPKFRGVRHREGNKTSHM